MRIGRWGSARTAGASVACAVLMSASAGLGQGAGPTAEELTKLQALDDAIDGAIVYVRNRKVYKIVIGSPDNNNAWTETELCDGDYARFSPDGSQIAVGYKGSVYVADAGTGDSTLVQGSYVVSGTIPPIDFHTNGTEIIFVQSGILAVHLGSQQIRPVAMYHGYDGEPGISLSGKRLAARDGHELYAIVAGADDESKKGDRLYAADACSAGLSPDGAYVMNNVNSHLTMTIRDWDGSNPVESSAACIQPEGRWDNHHWSNHPDYIAVQGDSVEECYVVDVSDPADPVGTRVTWTGGVTAPDLWVDKMVAISGKLTIQGTSPEEVVRGAVVGLAGEALWTHTDHDGEFMILGTTLEIPDGGYDIVAPGLTLETSPAVTVTGGAPSPDPVDLQVTELDADAGGPDGLPDWWELRYFLDLTITDGTGDQDDDGKTDRDEYLAGTSPVAVDISSPDGGDTGPCGSAGGAASVLLCFVVVAGLARRSRALRGLAGRFSAWFGHP